MKDKPSCSVLTCELPVKARLLCNTHYERFRKYGDPLITLKRHFVGSFVDRFWHYVQKSDSCWLWSGTTNDHGYGQIASGRRSRGAHIVSFEIANGPVPNDLCVLHKCDVRACVNPDHLFLGTKADNYADMVAKNRQYTHKGTANGQSKLTEDQVREIRELRKQGLIYAQIAERMGVSVYPVYSVLHRINWTHVI